MNNFACPNCDDPINEPGMTHVKECPKCRHLLLIPSRKDWQALKDDSDIQNLLS